MDWKRIGKKLLFPPIWLMLILTVASAALLIVIFLKGWEESPVAYISYVLAFYTLSVVTLFCVTVLPKRYKQIKQKIYDHPLGHRYMTDSAFRTRSTMYLSLYINLLYVLINLISWYTNRSWWFVVLMGYYLILAFQWALLAGYIRSNPPGSNMTREWIRSRICAYILLLINLSLSGAVLMILYQSKGYDYPGIMIYVMAMFTFYSTIHAIVDIVKQRSLGSPVMSTATIVRLSAALVSMLNLETAMFAQFGGTMSEKNQKLMIILTGAGVSITVVTLSVLLIVRANKEIRRKNHGK